jgi:glycogen debranching enzyme
MDNLTEICYKKSVELLEKNSGPSGFLAATPRGRAATILLHYDWIFGRDASICVLGAVASGEKKLIRTAKRSLLTLARQQSKRGQIPNAVSEKKKKQEFYFMNVADSTLWWLIALDFYHRYSGDKKLTKLLEPRIKKARRWLSYQTAGLTNLIVQAPASDWSDLMPRAGHTLYTNVLWYGVQKLYRLKGAEMTAAGLNALFYPFSRLTRTEKKFFAENFLYARLRQDTRKKKKLTAYYLNAVGTFTADDRCDVYGNILAILTGLPTKKLSVKIIQHLRKTLAEFPYPVPVLLPPVYKKDKDWHQAMERRHMNQPWHYHNGGIWPFVGGFWVMALAQAGKKKTARAELLKLARANSLNRWQFNEWLDGRTGKPSGLPGQSWNAATFILAYQYLKGKIKIF